MSSAPRIALVDDQALIRAGLRALLQQQGIDIAFEALCDRESGRDAQGRKDIDKFLHRYSSWFHKTFLINPA